MYILCHTFIVVIIGVCFVDFSDGHPISIAADTGVGVSWVVSVASVAVVTIALIMSACCFHWCRDWWRRKYGDFEHFTNSDVEGAASIDTSEGFVNPVQRDAAIVIPPQLAIHINNNEQEDNNNGPISPQELENIENNNAATYIVSENEDRNSLSPELRAREATARPLVRELYEQDNRALVTVQIETPPVVSPNRNVVESVPGPRNAELPIRAIAGTSNGVTLNCDILDRDWFSSPLDDFPRNHLKYLREIGRGWFGTIVEAEARTPHLSNPSNVSARVAVKILNQNVTQEEKRTFLSEGRLYRDVKHRNVLTLIGKNLSEEPWLMIYEMCSLGDLKQYLWTNKPKMASLNENGIPLRLQTEVADALAYVHSKGLVHTDVACRTVLVAAGPSGDAGSVHARLGDYGDSVSRHPEEYCTSGGLALPVRWCAPEALRTTTTDIVPNKLEPSADIWSLGVFLWEVCSWGQLPYQDISNDEVITALATASQTGMFSLHLLEPAIPCPYRSYLYQIMEMCWNVDSKNRPSALQVHELLSHLLEHHNQIYSPKSHWQESNVDDFESRWKELKPNSFDGEVPTEVQTRPQMKSNEVDSGSKIRRNDLFDFNPQCQAKSERFEEKSPSRNWFKRLRDDRSEDADKVIEMVPWLKGVPITCQEDISYMETVNNVITDLDNILSSEKTSSSESSHQTSPLRDGLPVNLKKNDNEYVIKKVSNEHKFEERCEEIVNSPLDFRLGYDLHGTSIEDKPHPIFETDQRPSVISNVFDSKSSLTPSILNNVKFGYDDKSGFYDTQRVYYSSGSETEDETWKIRVEMGALTEKVKMKSKSVTDLMVLTHIDTIDLESDSTPFNSLDFRINTYDTAYPSSKSDQGQTKEKLFKRHFSLVPEWRGSESLRPEIDILKVRRNASNWRIKNLRPIASMNNLSQLTKSYSVQELKEFKTKMDNYFHSANSRVKFLPNKPNSTPLAVRTETNNKLGANKENINVEKCDNHLNNNDLHEPEISPPYILNVSEEVGTDSFNSTSYLEFPDSSNEITSVLANEIDSNNLNIKSENLTKSKSDSDLCLNNAKNCIDAQFVPPLTLNKSLELINGFSKEQSDRQTALNSNSDYLEKSESCLNGHVTPPVNHLLEMSASSLKSNAFQNSEEVNDKRYIQLTALDSVLDVNGSEVISNERCVEQDSVDFNSGSEKTDNLTTLLNSKHCFDKSEIITNENRLVDLESSTFNGNDSLNSTSYLEIPDRVEIDTSSSPDIVNVGFVKSEELCEKKDSPYNNKAPFNSIKLEQLVVSDVVIQKCRDNDWAPEPSDSSVIIGPFEECTLELYSGLKTDDDRLNPEYLSEDEALAFSSNFTVLNNEIRQNVLNSAQSEKQAKTPIDVWKNNSSFAQPLAQSSPQIYDDLPYDKLDLIQQQFTSKLAIAENENNMNIEHSSPAFRNDELEDGTMPSEDNEQHSDQSSNCSHNSHSENSYREAFDLDDERVKLLRNELEMKLPLAQAYNEHVMGEMSDDSDSGQFALDDGDIGQCYVNNSQNGLTNEPVIDELSSEQNMCKGKINEVLIEYPNYNSTTLSPIVEETYSDMSEYGQKPVIEQQKQELSTSSGMRHIQSSKVSELSKKWSDKQQNHGKSTTIDSWCSNDTLFNVEDNFDDYLPTPSRETPNAEPFMEDRLTLSPLADEGDSESTYLIEDRFVDSQYPTEINTFDDNRDEQGDSDTFAVGENIKQITHSQENSCPSGENKTYIIDSKENICESGIHSDMTLGTSVFQTETQRCVPEKMRDGHVQSFKFNKMDSLNSADVFIDSQFEFLNIDDANDAFKPTKINEKFILKEPEVKNMVNSKQLELSHRNVNSAEIAGINNYDDFVNSLEQDLMSTLHSSYNQFEASAMTKDQDTGRGNKGYNENSTTESNCSSSHYLDNEVIAGVSLGYLEFVDSATKRQQNSENPIRADLTKSSVCPVVLNCTDNLDQLTNSQELNEDIAFNPFLLNAKTGTTTGSNSVSMEWSTFNSHEHHTGNVNNEVVPVKDNTYDPSLRESHDHAMLPVKSQSSDEIDNINKSCLGEPCSDIIETSDSSRQSPNILNNAFLESDNSSNRSGSLLEAILPSVISPHNSAMEPFQETVVYPPAVGEKPTLENQYSINLDNTFSEINGDLIGENALSMTHLDSECYQSNEDNKSLSNFNSSPQFYSAINNLFLLHEKSSCNSDLQGINSDDLMTTSFNQESPSNEEPRLPENQMNDNFSPLNTVKEWESETDDSHSNSSEDFVWKDGMCDSYIITASTACDFLDHKLQHSGMNKDETILEVEEENSDDDYDEDGEENDFTPSSWNRNAIPSKSSLKSPETSHSETKKQVAFKEEKFQNVYEYPREINTPEEELDPYITYYQPDYSSYSDWKTTVNSDVISSEQLVNPNAIDFQYTMPLSSLVDMSFMTSLPMYDGFESYSLNHSASQFFPGQNQDVQANESTTQSVIEPDPKTEEMEVEGFITPDSGMEDLSSGSPLAMNAEVVNTKENSSPQNETKPKEKTNLKIQLPVSSDHAPNSPSPSSGSNSPLSPQTLGGLRHTREKLKLNLPTSPLKK